MTKDHEMMKMLMIRSVNVNGKSRSHLCVFYSTLFCRFVSCDMTAQQRASPFVGRPSNLFSAKIHSVQLNQASCDQVNGQTHVEGTNASGLLFVCGNKISGEKKKKVFYFLIKSLKSIFLEYYQMEAVWLLSLLLLLMMMKIMMASVDDEVQLSRH